MVEHHYKVFPGFNEDDAREAARRMVPAARYGTPLDIARLAKAGHSAGATGTDVQQAAAIHPGDAASAGADRFAVDLIDAQHIAADQRLP